MLFPKRIIPAAFGRQLKILLPEVQRRMHRHLPACVTDMAVPLRTIGLITVLSGLVAAGALPSEASGATAILQLLHSRGEALQIQAAKPIKAVYLDGRDVRVYSFELHGLRCVELWPVHPCRFVEEPIQPLPVCIGPCRCWVYR